MKVFVTVSENFVLLTVTKFWESWSVLTEWVKEISHHLGRHLGLCRPWWLEDRNCAFANNHSRMKMELLSKKRLKQ
jgi:hypothetical protein